MTVFDYTRKPWAHELDQHLVVPATLRRCDGCHRPLRDRSETVLRLPTGNVVCIPCAEIGTCPVCHGAGRIDWDTACPRCTRPADPLHDTARRRPELRGRALFAIALAAAAVGAPPPPAGAADHITVGHLAARAHGDPTRCDIRPFGKWGPKQLKCVIRLTFPRRQWQNATRVADCESGWDTRSVSRTADYGLFQINRWYHPDAFHPPRRMFDPVANTAYARRLQKHSGWRPWVCATRLGIR